MKHPWAIMIALGCIFTADAQAQFIQQGSKIVGTEFILGTPARLGASVSLSSDGNTACVGGPIDMGFDAQIHEGASWVFVRSNGVWTQQVRELEGSGVGLNARQGFSVSLSSDGNTAIVGGPFDTSNAGTWVFTRSGSAWTQQGLKFVESGAKGASHAGYSVSLSADGNTALVGGPDDSTSTGATWVFTRGGSAWTQQGKKLVATGAAGAAHQGTSVALSSDGNTAIIGAPADSGNAGAAWIFTRNGTVWTQQGGKLVGSGAVGTANQGASVALSSDGNTAIIGGYGDNGSAGAAWVFARTAGVWAQRGGKLIGTGAAGAAEQGYSVSLSGDGTTAMVGGPGDNGGSGAAWAFSLVDGVWSQLGEKITGSGAYGTSQQGFAVALSSDGSTAIVGGPGDLSYDSVIAVGAVWAYSALPGRVPLLYPADQATIGSTVIPFVWRKPSANPIMYAFSLATDSLFTFQNTDSTLTDTTKVVTGLSGGVTYWWKVKAKNEAGWGPFGEKHRFTLTSTGAANQSPRQVEFQLAQNYPNPFNPSTRIRYQTSAAGVVSLNVFDVLGRQVTTLVQGFEQAGPHEVVFNGSGLASGVYLYRLTSGTHSQTRSLLIIK